MAIVNSFCSSKCDVVIWSPIGRPLLERLEGTVTAGTPGGKKKKIQFTESQVRRHVASSIKKLSDLLDECQLNPVSGN